MENIRKLGFVQVFLAAVFWSLGGVLVKLVPWHAMAITGLRSGIAGIVIYLYLIKKSKGKKNIKTVMKFNRNKYLGALAFATSVLLYVVANKLTTAANAILLQFTAPIWVALISHFFLKEYVKRKDWLTIGVVIIGMSLFFLGDLKPGNMLGNFVAIGSGIAWALAIILLRYQETAMEMTLLGCIISFTVAIPFYFSLSYSIQAVMGILALGIFQLGMGWLMFTLGAPKVSALESTLIPVIEPILNPIWVLLCLGETIGPWSIVGGLIVISSIIFKSITDNRRKKRYIHM